MENKESVIIQWNLNGIRTRKKSGELQRLIAEYDPVCLCLQHIGDYDTTINNYKLVSQSIKTTTELGTAIYVRNNITVDNIIIQSSECQYSATTIHLSKNNKFSICNIYNQPSFNYNLENIRNIITNLPEPYILMGDFNAHSPIWDENCLEADNPGRKIELLMDELNLNCLNEENTYTYLSHTNGAMSSIDITMCSTQIIDRFEWCTLEDRYTSDHAPILITCLRETEQERPTRYITDHADWTKYKITASSIPEFNEELHIEESYQILKNCIITAADNSIPKSKTKKGKKEVPWWSKELKELLIEKHRNSNKLIRLKKKLSKLMNETNLRQEQKIQIINTTIHITSVRINLNKISAIFKREVRKRKEESWKKYLSSINSRTPIKKIWKRFRKVNGGNTSPPKHALKINGVSIHDTKEICDHIGKQLKDTSSNDNYERQFQQFKINAETKEKFKFNNKSRIHEEYNANFTMEELNEAVSRSGNTAPGKDKINFAMIEQLPLNTKQYIIDMYNFIWNNDIIPEEWTHSTVIPIPKPGKDPSNPLNYRPISLTSCLCKTMEKMVNERLTWILKEKRIIIPTQYGAEKGRSTIDPLANLEESIRKGFNEKKMTVAIFFDIEKAYDTTWKHLILKTLKQQDIDGNLPTFIKNFLNNRTFQIRMENTYSETYEQVNGIPQGSVLSCSLFKLAINTIADDLPNDVKDSLFMDDFCVYMLTRSLRHAERMLNLVLRHLEKWSKRTGFKFSTEKTKAVIFIRDKRWKKNYDIQLSLNNTVIPVIESQKFLGVILDDHLNFKQHVQYLKGKSKKALNLIRKISHTTWGADRKTLLTLYKTTVLSILDYGSQIYGSASKTVLKALEPIHNEGIRLVTGAFRSTPVASLLVESGEPSLSNHREKVTMKTATRIMTSDSPTKEIFNKPDMYWKPNGSEGTAPFPIRAQRLLREHDIKVNQVTKPQETAPWVKKRAVICTKMLQTNKQNINPHVLRQKALEHINQAGRHLAIFTDGSKSQEGTGCAAITTIATRKRSLDNKASIYTAELIAIQEALNIIEETNFPKNIIYSDSKSSILGIMKYSPTNHIIQQIQEQINRIKNNRDVNITLCWIPAHVGVAGNELADQAAKDASMQQPEEVELPAGDYYPVINEAISTKWQREWDTVDNTNKLKNIKKKVKAWETSNNMNRKIEVILTRLRTGHTNMTHSFLMSRPQEERPECQTCRMPLTVKHIFEVCTTTIQERRNIFQNRRLEDILEESEDFSTEKIIQFLKKMKLINKL